MDSKVVTGASHLRCQRFLDMRWFIVKMKELRSSETSVTVY